MEKKLTEKQKRFIDFYIETANAAESARRAGYSEKTARSVGQENLTKPDIKKAIDKRLKELESTRIADTKEVLETLTAVMRGEMKNGFAAKVDGGFEVIEAPISIKDRLKAAELLLKRQQDGVESQYRDDGLLDALNKAAKDVWD